MQNTYPDSLRRLKQQLLHEFQQVQADIFAAVNESSLLPAQALRLQLDTQPISRWVDVLHQAGLTELRPQLSRLEQLDAALCQYDIGLFGLCADCEQEIEPERLAQDGAEQRCACCDQKHQKEMRHKEAH